MALEEKIANANRECIDRMPGVIFYLRTVHSTANGFFHVTPSTGCIIGAIVAVGIRTMTTTGVASIPRTINACVAQVCLRRALHENQMV